MTINKTLNYHQSVLSNEVIEAVFLDANGVYVDATVGRGGHSTALLSKLSGNGRLIAIDQDHAAYEFCKHLFLNEQRVQLVESNFVHLKKVLTSLKIDQVDGILLDIGVSSPQIDDPSRGFSYINDGPLDMRMNQSQPLTAYEVVNTYPVDHLCNIFKKYGEINNPKPVVLGIIKAREKAPIKTTQALVDIIRANLLKRDLFKKNKHPEKVYFQALRLFVNQELEVLSQVIRDAAYLLKPKGRLAIISFHSLEDKIIKKAFADLSVNHLPKEVPLNQSWCEFKNLYPKGIRPSAAELEQNPRSKSAILRVLERLDFAKTEIKNKAI